MGNDKEKNIRGTSTRGHIFCSILKMHYKYTLLVFVFISYCSILFAQDSSKLKILYVQNNEIIIVVDSLLHINYGFAYPMTYSISAYNLQET